ncbi:TIGR03089 family protein [Cellulomonas sp. B6]|jgi:uncharacterized protein (TIGR03089 family)|uniref:TIGR03089 family protein n=1 Tax=Cellulomonas sp. B6 TaxID=1295626 RepID=UPI00073BD459|nr:TIGR03089 family protein [Cellulomonas sp. B6]KSW29280.1 hypothetical protein ATM99_09000 [Cellulomonas sp. B6]
MGTPAAGRPLDVATVLAIVTRDPGRPRLTWYGVDGERVELSGAVVDNWVSKTTNLLVEEFDAAPGARVLLDLPPHWRAVLWTLATWRAGACATRAGDADVVVTDRPQEHPGAPDLVAVALPALARGFPGDLPAGAVDAATAVMTYGDALGPVPPTPSTAPAVDGATAVTFADLIEPHPAPTRRLVDAGAHDAVSLARLALASWAVGGSVVVVDAGTASTLRADPTRRTRLVTGEKVDEDALTDR